MTPHLEAQIGRGIAGRVQDRVERRVERQINRDQRGFYFNDANWTDLEPVFRQYDIQPFQARTRTEARADTRFGYNNPNDADGNWYYDWYDYPNSFYYPAADGQQAYSYQYLDTNNDGIYDRGYTVYDRDGDGRYDQADEYQFRSDTRVAQRTEASNEAQTDRPIRRNDATDNNAAGTADTQRTYEPMAEARQITFQGEVQKTKSARRQGNQHMLLLVQANAQGNTAESSLVVDAGPVDQLRDVKIMQGDSVQVTGRMVSTGEKPLVIAEKLVVGDQTVDVQLASRKPLNGTVLETRTVEVQQQPHTFVILKTQQGNQVVDMGPQDSLDMELAANKEVTIYGAPVQMRDRQVYLAHQVQYDGQDYTIRPFTRNPDQN